VIHLQEPVEPINVDDNEYNELEEIVSLDLSFKVYNKYGVPNSADEVSLSSGLGTFPRKTS
jgi:hypothetical protein